ncbi:MAG TPA: GNAT family N-acetyltransferase, partial [Solirubrobacterales bacterium]|nr:GNAT family N-acetyltransferase [Solirubrobacterales bacterium]
WLQLVRSGMPPLWALLAESTGGSVWHSGGVTAAIVPRSPKRSFFNSVLYEDPESMVGSIDHLARLYAEAGVEAWTVWVPEADAAVAQALGAAGHRLDATPRAMAMPIGDLRAPEPDPELEIREEPDYELVCRINEVAYGFAPGEFPAMRGDLSALRTYLGSIDGETVACAGAFTHGGDCEIVFVAVLPEGRGRGVSGRLMARALADAREQGLETTTLQATKLGYPVYAKLGYGDHGELQMWERRK